MRNGKIDPMELRYGIMLSIAAHLLQLIALYGPTYERQEQLEDSNGFWRGDTGSDRETYDRYNSLTLIELSLQRPVRWVVFPVRTQSTP